MRVPNNQYNLANPNSLPMTIALYQRRKMFRFFRAHSNIMDSEQVLDIGATSDRTYSNSNYFECMLHNKERITAVGLEDASFLESQYPGLRFVRANALSLPFENMSFDVVHSSAVFEHVGNRQNQIQYLKEALRVARRYVFITTPYRFFPIEFHTMIPLIHWLPKNMHRNLLAQLGMEFFSREENLNLVGDREFEEIISCAIHGLNYEYKIANVRLLGLKTNLILCASRITSE